VKNVYCTSKYKINNTKEQNFLQFFRILTQNIATVNEVECIEPTLSNQQYL